MRVTWQVLVIPISPHLHFLFGMIFFDTFGEISAHVIVLQDEGVCTLEDITGPEREYRDYVQKQYDIIDTELPKVCQ